MLIFRFIILFWVTNRIGLHASVLSGVTAVYSPSTTLQLKAVKTTSKYAKTLMRKLYNYLCFCHNELPNSQVILSLLIVKY